MWLSQMDVYEDCYNKICEIKGIEKTIEGFNAYKIAMQALYHAVCLDIDDTLTYKNAKEKRMIVESLAYLTKRNVIICFITGRGKTSAFEFLNDLRDSIRSYDNGIHEDQFRRWYCITNNGYMLFCHESLDRDSFLKKNVSLVDASTKREYMKLKPALQERVASLFSSRLSISKAKIISDSNASIGENSLRFPFSPDFAALIDDSLIEELRKIVSSSTKYGFGVSRGIYQKNGKTVVEISMTTKGWAIDKFEEYLGIPENKMVRIGDQGDFSGNDYEMLNSRCGFSVGNYSASQYACWPVVKSTTEYDCEILKGSMGTTTLLNSLRIFPTICLEKPNREVYLPRLAMSESRSMDINRETYEYYQNLLGDSFVGRSNRKLTVWDYINEHTGGFFIHDYEYELLRAANPEHILFKIYDVSRPSISSKQPGLVFSLKTDSGRLLRGPLNYYYGLSFRHNNSSNLSRNFLRRFNQYRVFFFKTCINSIKNAVKVDLKDSITRRVLLGIMDSIRDYLLIFINIKLQSIVGQKDVLYVFSTKQREVYNLFLLAQQNLIYMYNCLFNNVDLNFSERFLSFLQHDIMPLANAHEEYLQSLSDFDYKKGFRVWREIDSFYENIIAIDTSISKLIYECDIGQRELLFYGMRYGSLELPVIASMLLEVKYKYFEVKHSIGALCLSSNYINNHSGTLDANRSLHVYNRKKLDSDNLYHILMDDNLVTGRTLQLGVNMLIKRNIYPNKVIVVRYPAINRIEHMFLPNHGAPDPDLFWEYIYGLTSPTPYSRLNYPYSFKKKPDEMYLDELGEFNKTRSYVLNLLYKNGLFSPDSEVAQRGD